MDPLSILTILGVAAVGRSLSMRETYDSAPAALPEQTPQPFFANNINTPPPASESQYQMKTGPYIYPQSKQEVESFATIAPNASKDPFGNPVYNLYDRVNASSLMNGTFPAQKNNVGPGLGLDPSVPAAGGFQQGHRVMPNNVNGYKLTTLPGRAGHAASHVQAGAKVGELGHNRPERTTALFERRPEMRGRATVTGATGRQNHEKAKRQTNRSMTTLRDDNLAFGAASSVISALPPDHNPTRSKGDFNMQRVNDVATPGIASFHGAYSTQETQLRHTDRRGKDDRMGNPGGMNVRMDPVNQGGAVTAMRAEYNSAYMGNAGTTTVSNQTYSDATYHQFNPYKGNEDFRTANLGIAKKQLANNPLNNNFS